MIQAYPPWEERRPYLRKKQESYQLNMLSLFHVYESNFTPPPPPPPLLHPGLLAMQARSFFQVLNTGPASPIKCQWSLSPITLL